MVLGHVAHLRPGGLSHLLLFSEDHVTSHDVFCQDAASSSVSVEALLNLICSRALAVLEEFQPLPLTNFVWSLAGAEGCSVIRPRASLCHCMPLLLATNGMLVSQGLQTGGVPFPRSVGARVRKLVRQHNPQQARQSGSCKRDFGVLFLAPAERLINMKHAGCEQRLGIWQGRLPRRAAAGSDKGAGCGRWHEWARQPKAGKHGLGMGDACSAKDGLLQRSCRGLNQARAGTQDTALRQHGLGSRTCGASSREVVGCNRDDLPPDGR